jgi:hypothetical protein
VYGWIVAFLPEQRNAARVVTNAPRGSSKTSYAETGGVDC